MQEFATQGLHEVMHLINEMSPYLLLGFFLAGLMHAFIPGTLYSRYLSRPNMRSVVNAALFGIPLPLCSCGVIPTAMSLRRDGASRGAVSSFLVATPQTGVDSIIATFSLMGWPFAVARPLIALFTAVLSGGMVNAFGEKDEANANSTHASNAPSTCERETCHLSFWQRLKEAFVYAYGEMMEDIGKWLVIGLIVAGLITVFVPAEFFAVFKGNSFASMLLVLCISIPMYICATGSIPIAVALMMKGLTPGAGLVLLMAGPACNMASILVINKVLGRRTLITYLGSIIFGSVGFGLLVDWLQQASIIDFTSALVASEACCETSADWFSWTCTIVLIALLLNVFVLQPLLGHKHHHAEEVEAQASNVYKVSGMNCSHCATNVQKALMAVEGVESVTVDHKSGEAHIVGTPSREDLADALSAIGFTLE